MNWDDVRFFLALCREESVSRAGKSLGVNHTTVARRIAVFEKELGTRLFDRQPNGYAMTQSAENIYAHALDMEERVQAIDREVFGRDTELKGLLKLTVAHDVADRLVVPKLAQFKAAYPLIDVELLTTTGLVDLAARQADIAVRLTHKPPDYLVGRRVLSLQHGIYASASYLEKQNDPVDVILFRGDAKHPAWVEEHFQGARIALRVDDVVTMSAVVGNHQGLARMPCYIGDSDASLRRLDLELVPSDWGIWVLSHVDLRSTARVRVCREFLFSILEEQRTLVLGEQSIYWSKRSQTARPTIGDP